jgi:hypothetical protein
MEHELDFASTLPDRSPDATTISRISVTITTSVPFKTTPRLQSTIKVARVKFPSEMVALLAIFRITNRYFPDFPGVDTNTFIEGHLQTLRVSLNLIVTLICFNKLY